jgi:hypothetical protein
LIQSKYACNVPQLMPLRYRQLPAIEIQVNYLLQDVQFFKKFELILNLKQAKIWENFITFSLIRSHSNLFLYVFISFINMITKLEIVVLSFFQWPGENLQPSVSPKMSYFKISINSRSSSLLARDSRIYSPLCRERQ